MFDNFRVVGVERTDLRQSLIVIGDRSGCQVAPHQLGQLSRGKTFSLG